MATRKIISCFFIVLVIAPLLFSLAVSIEKWDIRQGMNEKLEYKQLQTIHLTESEVVFMDKHEIWVNNHMFDIHSKKLENGIYTFTGLYDEDETELVKKQKNKHNKDPEQSRILGLLFKYLPAFCSQPVESKNLSPQHLHTLYSLDQAPQNQYLEILTPPPRA